MHVWLVFIVLLISVSACWNVYPGPRPGSGPDSYRVYGWAYGKTTEPIGIKEPVPVTALKVLGSLGVPVRESAKLAGLSAFVLLVSLTMLMLRVKYGVWAGSFAALLVAVNPYVGYYAALGPGEIFPIFFFLAFWYALENGNMSLHNLLAISVFAALAALSKIIFLLFTTGVLALWVLEQRSAARLRLAVYSALVTCAIVSPYFIYQASVFGSPLSLQENLLRKWNNNALEGPILEAPFNGGPMSPGEFIAGRGVGGYASGMKKTFLSILPRMARYKIELFFGLLGFVLLFIKGKWLLPSVFFVFLAPVALIAGINQVPATGSVELRFFLGSFWLICVYAGIGFQGFMDSSTSYISSLPKAKE